MLHIGAVNFDKKLHCSIILFIIEKLIILIYNLSYRTGSRKRFLNKNANLKSSSTKRIYSIYDNSFFSLLIIIIIL